ncbi:XRE family transcriptional regulator [Streptomyces sp. OF3]|uniref:XRE family transcriptional regulator n=1 Tax=Streptomyces alkaliterrae TaxID=2213162 RepID=A0A7W3WKV2_9ACTN|nr:XRE family transcriptional regulator [Streptomyces alkaliterrae]MBB1254159.1 XRE family transcriptional regulator [Streptomyces alkaliterrae]
MTGNKSLRRRMAEVGLTQVELAESINRDLRAAGYAGTVSDRTVRNWLTGKTRWPHRRQRAALEALFDCPAIELGFAPRDKTTGGTPVRPENAVLRRQFLSASTGATIAAVGGTVAATGAPLRVGMSDVERLHAKFAVIVASDHRYGGKVTIESQAAGLAGEALSLLARGSASQRVRSALYGCAASFTSSALWAAIDGRRFDAAQRHFDRASSLATMSGDSTIQFRIWSHAGSLFRHMARPTDALAANDVARNLPIARRVPLFASLGHARQAAIHGLTGDTRAAWQALGHAERAYERADKHIPRPVWMAAVKNRAELEELALSATLSLADYARAEAHAHRSLALLGASMGRDRAIVTARLAIAQLRQGEAEAAVATARSISPALIQQLPRVAHHLGVFDQALQEAQLASSVNDSWVEHRRYLKGNP